MAGLAFMAPVFYGGVAVLIFGLALYGGSKVSFQSARVEPGGDSAGRKRVGVVGGLVGTVLIAIGLLLTPRDSDGSSADPTASSVPTTEGVLDISMSTFRREGDELRVVGEYEGELGDDQAIAVVARAPSSERWEVRRADVNSDGTWHAEIQAKGFPPDTAVSAGAVDDSLFGEFASNPDDPDDQAAMAKIAALREDLERRGPAASGVEAATEPVTLED